jgi:hypothetical protein
VGRHSGYLLGTEIDSALGLLIHTADTIEQRGLACTVGTYECIDLPFIEMEVHSIQGPEAPEADGKTLDV